MVAVAKKMSSALQDASEFDWFCTLLKAEGVKSYLEIGSKYGGSLKLAAQSLPIGSRIVAVDLPWGDRSSAVPLQNVVAELQAEGYDVHLILGDSTDPEVINQVKALGPFDACFIDANHTIKYVTSDWQNYGALCKLVAFHDINFWRDQPMPAHKLPIEVPILWKQLKSQYPNKEIRLDPQNNGIGVLWRT